MTIRSDLNWAVSYNLTHVADREKKRNRWMKEYREIQRNFRQKSKKSTDENNNKFKLKNPHIKM